MLEFLVGGTISLVFFLLVYPAIKIFIGVYIAKDAKKNGLPASGAWGWLCFFLPLMLGLPIYYIFRDTRLQNKHKSGHRYCVFCGKPVGKEFMHCPYCGAPIK